MSAVTVVKRLDNCYIFMSYCLLCKSAAAIHLCIMKASCPVFSEAFSSASLCVGWREIVGHFHWVLFRMHDSYLMEIVTEIERAAQYLIFLGYLSAWRVFLRVCICTRERKMPVFPFQHLGFDLWNKPRFCDNIWFGLEMLALMLQLTPRVSKDPSHWLFNKLWTLAPQKLSQAATAATTTKKSEFLEAVHCPVYLNNL